MSAYERLLALYQEINPGPVDADAFNAWTIPIMEIYGVDRWEDLPDEAFNADVIMPQLGYEKTTEVPLEQGLLQTALPSLLTDINADAGRRTLADSLAAGATQGTQAAQTQLARTQGGGFDGRTYLAQNPDVAAAFEQSVANDPTLDLNTFAEQHFLQYGQREGRQPAYIQSAQLAQDFNNADQTAAANIAAANQAFQTNLGALTDATAAMQTNLSGNLAEKAAALQQQIATLTQNLDTLDATQRKALTDQIASMQGNLEQSVAMQRQALQDQVAALGTAATAEATARRAALQTEIAALNEAQAPLAEARMKAAELQATAVNVGLEQTRDQLTADQARAGYIGGSTFGDAALARATIGARSQAAQAVSGARVANAGDTREIATRGATGERSIADALAAANRDIAGLGATGNRSLTDTLATERRRIGDTGATGLASITNQTALSRAGIGAQGANQTFNDQVFGADQKRSLGDALAQGKFGLTNTLSGQTLAANQQGNAAKATYYDNDYNRNLTAALAQTQLPTNLTNTLTGLDNYAQSGLGRTLNTLGWWGTNSGAAPTPQATAVQADTTGNSISGLGSGLFGAALNYGNSNSWWQQPKPKAGTVDTDDPGA